jgi:hypothetical protein
MKYVWKVKINDIKVWMNVAVVNVFNNIELFQTYVQLFYLTLEFILVSAYLHLILKSIINVHVIIAFK